MRMDRGYAAPRVMQTANVCLERGFLTGSVVDSMTVESTGQEVGGVYDYGTSTTFNHEWGE